MNRAWYKKLGIETFPVAESKLYCKVTLKKNNKEGEKLPQLRRSTKSYKVDFFLFSFFNVRYSTVLELPTLRFRCVVGFWDRTQDCCDFRIDINADALTTLLDLIHYVGECQKLG